MKKYLYLCLLLFFVCLNIIGCNGGKEIDMKNRKSYSLSEFQEYFGILSPEEQIVYSNEEYVFLKKDDVNQKFPIEYIRVVKDCPKNDIEYTVYKVKEGGYYYVFFNKMLSDSDEYYVAFSAYLTELKDKSDFNSIKIGESTADDVSKIDSAMELIFVVSHGLPSLSLLEDGTNFVIYYKYNEDIKSRNDLIVEKTEISRSFKGYLSYVYPEDLP